MPGKEENFQKIKHGHSVPQKMPGTSIKADITKAVEIQDWKYCVLLNVFFFRRTLGRNTEKNFPPFGPRARKL